MKNFPIAVVDPFYVLAIVCLVELLILGVVAIWAGLQQLYIRSLHAQQIELIRETTSTLHEVTAIVPNITRTLESNAYLVPQVKTEMITCLNQMEVRITTSIDRLAKIPAITNNFLPIDDLHGERVNVGDNRVG